MASTDDDEASNLGEELKRSAMRIDSLDDDTSSSSLLSCLLLLVSS
jgi:hypothetical protein